MLVKSPRQFRQALSHRAVINVPSGQWRGGPFFLDVTLPNAAVAASNLTVHDAWYSDQGVRGAYGVTDGDVATRLKATVHVEAVELWLYQGSISKLDVDTKQKLFATGTAPYINCIVGTATHNIPLYGAISEVQELKQVTQAAAAAGEFGALRGKPYVLPSPIRIDMENDTFSLKSDAAPALGADELGKLVVYGCIFPGSLGIPGFIPGVTCGAEGGDGDEGISLEAIRAQSVQSIGIYRPFGL